MVSLTAFVGFTTVALLVQAVFGANYAVGGANGWSLTADLKSWASTLSFKVGDTLNFDDMTPLQKHVSFFDRNKDGLIYPTETFKGFRAIGVDVATSTASAAIINGALHLKTLPNGTLPSPLLPIYIENINRGKHGSDSGTYDTEGRFVPEKFEEIFQKHAHTNPNALTKDEVAEMLKANQEPNDRAGSIGASTEWNLLYSLCKDKDGLLQKETIKSIYDGSLFYQLENQNAAAKSQKKASPWSMK